jgi:hypothetical protein
MKLKLILTAAIIGTILALPTVSGAAAPPPPPSPQLDTATATGSVGGGIGGFTNIRVDAHSGPSGENPGGFASFDTTVQLQVGSQTLDLDVAVSGPVTCLNVTGNAAVIKIDGTLLVSNGAEFFNTVEIDLIDNGGSGSDLFSTAVGGAPADCSGGPVFGSPLDGRAVVFDAKPLPTTKEQCMNGGWKQIGFINEGLCIAFVERGP